jgi:DNA-binding MarR family transcriptional regulator
VAEWGFLSNHGRVLAHISLYPDSTVRQMSDSIKITEWTVHKVLRDLEKSRYIERHRVGRRNIYHVNSGLHLREDMFRDVVVGDLLATLRKTERARNETTREKMEKDKIPLTLRSGF